MGILYEQMIFQEWAILLFVLLALMAFNEFERSTKCALTLPSIILPVNILEGSVRDFLNILKMKFTERQMLMDK